MKIPSEFIADHVRIALTEDYGPGDIHDSLVNSGKCNQATVLSRTHGILCGQDFVNETCRQTAASIEYEWCVNEGARIHADEVVLKLFGPSYLLLRIERTLLNFLQLLSGTATRTHEFVSLIAHTKAKILDTRKTLPHLRMLQKYAVKTGGGENHRFGLFDAFLLKENHIIAAGGIRPALQRASKSHPDKFLEIEVETLTELKEALLEQPDRIMLDNFSLSDTKSAVALVRQYERSYGLETELEASGQINLSNVVAVAETGVDYISLGTLTKDVKALDFSMRLF